MGHVSRVGGLAICLIAALGSVGIARTTRATLSGVFPGVDAQGNLDYGYRASQGVVRATYNDRRGRLRIVSRTVVENDSYRSQVFTGVGIVDQFNFNGAIAADVYRVNARGKATYNGLLIASTGF